MDASDEAIGLSWAKAIAIAFRSHKNEGVPVASWDNDTGRVVLISPDELLISEEEKSFEAVTPKTEI